MPPNKGMTRPVGVAASQLISSVLPLREAGRLGGAP